MMAWNYSKVMDYFLHPRNVGEIKDADGVGESATSSAAML